MNEGESPATILVYAAVRLPGPDGAVERSDTPIDEDDAIARLTRRGDIVVCSEDRRANRNKGDRPVLDAGLYVCLVY